MPVKKTEPKLTEIAARINQHLKALENNKKVNKTCSVTHCSPYYYAGAWAAGRYVRVCYVRYQGASTLTRAEALKYLEHLDGGGTDEHWEVLRQI
jgi:hypothetical protein